jgi:hypothetical protein
VGWTGRVERQERVRVRAVQQEQAAPARAGEVLPLPVFPYRRVRIQRDQLKAKVADRFY